MILSLRWAANQEPDLLAYRIYVGRAPGVYDVTFEELGFQFPFKTVEAPTSIVVLTLPDGIRWYCAVAAVDTAGNEQPTKSNEVSAINKRIKGIKR